MTDPQITWFVWSVDFHAPIFIFLFYIIIIFTITGIWTGLYHERYQGRTLWWQLWLPRFGVQCCGGWWLGTKIWRDVLPTAQSVMWVKNVTVQAACFSEC